MRQSIQQKDKKPIIVAVTNDLATDRRVDRTCRALCEAGWQPLLVGRRLPESPALPQRGYAMRRMRLLFRRSVLFYAEYNFRLLLLLLTSHADAFMANDTDTLAACCLAARWRRKRLLFDAHELFPDVPELVEKPRVQRVWRWIERKCLPHVDTAFTVCQSLADEYHRRYGVQMTVVRNLPENTLASNTWEEDKMNGKPFSPSAYRTLLYQGAVNVGRGVRELIDVLELLPNCRLVVAGDGDLLEEMQQYAATRPWANRVELLGRVLPDRLQHLTTQADLGMCLLEDLGLSYRYALPNRVGDFAAAGVPLLATDFVEIRRVLQEYGTGTLTQACPHTKEGPTYRQYLTGLANDITAALDYWNTMPPDEKQNRFRRASTELCWQQEKQRFLSAL